MKAAWYERFGPAEDVLIVGEIEVPEVAPGEVLVRVYSSGINPSDVKLRAGARPGAKMEYPALIPHSDGAGIIEAVGPGVATSRIGQRVWIWNASWQRDMGTAAEYVALPSEQAVELPENASFAEAACLGIPAMTAWYALFAEGPIEGETVLVTGGAGTVGRYACQMARLGGAKQVITTISSEKKAVHAMADHAVNYKQVDVEEAVMDLTNGEGVDRIVEVDFGGNQEATVPLIKPGGVVAAYASAGVMEPSLQFYPLMFKDVTLRMLIVYQLRGELRRKGEAQLTEWMEAGVLSHAVVPCGDLDEIAKAHQIVEAGEKTGTVVIGI